MQMLANHSHQYKRQVVLREIIIFPAVILLHKKAKCTKYLGIYYGWKTMKGLMDRNS